MSVTVGPLPLATIDYPENDGNPMSDNMLQFHWIMTLKGGLDDLFRDQPDVLVAGDLLWYPVEGNNKLRTAPDVMVVFDRSKEFRGSYMQWRENSVAPHVVFEVLSPGNRPGEMARKLLFYEEHGVEEYYIYDPDYAVLTGYRRDLEGMFAAIDEMHGYVSPRLGIRFDTSGDELVIHRPDGGQFRTYLEQAERADELDRQLKQLHAKLKAAGIVLPEDQP